jgi:DNA-binding transcriptional LysR family regulator
VHGRTFAPRAAAVFDELRRAAQELTWVANGDQGNLRLGTVPMPAIPFLPLAIKRLADARPKVFVSVVEAREAELLDRLRKRDIEMAILRLSLVEPGDDMDVAQLYEEKLCVVAHKDHRLAQRTSLSWPELAQERWVMPPADCDFFGHVFRTLQGLDMEMPQHTVEAYSIQIQFGMVLHAGMLSFGMRSQIDFAPGKEFAVRLPFELPVAPRAVAAVSLSSHEHSPLASQLIGHIRDLAGSDAGTPARGGRTLASSPAG